MNNYRSILKPGEAEYEDRKSVFIGYAFPVTSEEQAQSYIKTIKSKHSDARHHVYAYVLRENNIARFSDDREPQGTAGMPTLDVIRKNNLLDCLVVVVRYFGGTLLGTGGLVKAYGSAARDAVLNGEIIEYAPYTFSHFVVSYQDYQKILPVINTTDIRIESTEFQAQVEIIVSYREDMHDSFVRKMIDITSARTEVHFLKTEYDYRKI